MRANLHASSDQREAETVKVSEGFATIAGVVAAGVTRLEVLGYFSSFGYRWEGTWWKKVTASQPARMTEETLTKWRSCITYYGKVYYVREHFLCLIVGKGNSKRATIFPAGGIDGTRSKPKKRDRNNKNSACGGHGQRV